MAAVNEAVTAIMTLWRLLYVNIELHSLIWNPVQRQTVLNNHIQARQVTHQVLVHHKTAF